MPPHRVFESHEAVAHPPSGSTVSADVGEGLVIVTIRSAEGNLLYGLVHNEVLRERTPETISHKHTTLTSTEMPQQVGEVTPEMVLSFSKLFKRCCSSIFFFSEMSIIAEQYPAWIISACSQLRSSDVLSRPLMAHSDASKLVSDS